MEIEKGISFAKDENGYSIFIGGDNESGIKVKGSSKEEVIKNLIPYLEDIVEVL